MHADLLVHYGHACLSLTARLPTLYVFSKLPIDVELAAQAISSRWEESAEPLDAGEEKAAGRHAPLVLLYEVGYAHQMPALSQSLAEKLKGRGVQVLTEQIDASSNFEGKLQEMGAEARSGISAESLADEAARSTQGQSAERRTKACSNESDGQGQNGQACADCSCGLAPAPASSSTPSSDKARRLDLPPGVTLADCDIVYVGGESLHLTNLLLSHPPSTRAPRVFITYDPSSSTSASSTAARIEDGRSTNRLLMRRYALVQKAKDASVIGLLVGTLGIRSYLPLLQNLRQLLTGPGSRRKVYTISVGKLNPAKLANFQEIDLFVLVACPENSLALHGSGSGSHAGRDYFKPVITPFEMVVALRSQREGDGASGGWEQGYELDLQSLSSQSRAEYQVGATAAQDSAEAQGGEAGSTEEQDGGGEDEEKDADRPHFSLVSGSFVSRRAYHTFDPLSDGADEASKEQRLVEEGDASASDSRTIALRQADGTLTRVLDSASHAQGKERSWRGLERRLGMDAPAVLEEGRAGIAKGYAEADGTHEGSDQRQGKN